MPNIVGTITNSTGTPLDGVLNVSLPAVVTDDSTTPDTVRTTVFEEFTITAGQVDIDLPETQTQEVPYRFTFLPTGANENLFSIDAIVENVATIQFASFFPTGITNRTLDTSALRVSRLIATDTNLSQLVKQPSVFNAVAEGITSEKTWYLPKPFEGAVRVRSLTTLGISGFEDWDYQLGLINSSGNDEILSVSTMNTNTENGRRRIHQAYDISRAASILGLFIRVTPQSGAGSLTATMIASYTEI